MLTITSWLEVRVLPAPPRIQMLIEISRSPFGICGDRPSDPRHRRINIGPSGAQSGDRLEQLAAMPDRRDTQVLQVFRR
jgi:hypothetical protein